MVGTTLSTDIAHFEYPLKWCAYCAVCFLHGRCNVVLVPLPLCQSPCEIKKREMSWTLTKKVGLLFAGPGDIKRREVVLDPVVCPEEIKSREVELGSEIWTCLLLQLLLNSSATDIVLVTLLRIAVETAIA